MEFHSIAENISVFSIFTVVLLKITDQTLFFLFFSPLPLLIACPFSVLNTVTGRLKTVVQCWYLGVYFFTFLKSFDYNNS